MAAIDFGRTAHDYGRHRAGFPAELFARLAARGIGVAGQRRHDVGTGCGTLARGFAQAGCTVSASDPAAALLDEARRLDAEAGVTVRYHVGRAERLALADGTLDVLSAGQCWHWFDRTQAAGEAMRVLQPGGVLLIAHFDWLPLAGNVVAMTEALIQQHNPAWEMGGGCGIHPLWFGDLAAAGFAGIESFSFDVMVPYSHHAWRGRIRASAGVAASLAPAAVAEFDAELAARLAADYPAAPLLVPHRVFAVWGCRP